MASSSSISTPIRSSCCFCFGSSPPCSARRRWEFNQEPNARAPSTWSAGTWLAGWLSSSPNCQAKAEAPGQNIVFPRVYPINLLKHTPRSYQKYHRIFIKSPQKIPRHKITMLDNLRYPYPYPIPSYHWSPPPMKFPIPGTSAWPSRATKRCKAST